MLRAIQELPHTVSHFISNLERRTGWAFTILMGGPDPHLGGEISVGRYVIRSALICNSHLLIIHNLSCHAGLTPHGSNFAEVFPSFDSHYQAPFTKFLSGIYRKLLSPLLLINYWLTHSLPAESIHKSRALFNCLDSKSDECVGGGKDQNLGEQQKDPLRGLIQKNGDRISTTGLYSSSYIRSLAIINVDCHSAPAQQAPKKALETTPIIIGDSGPGHGELCTTLFLCVSHILD